MKFMIEYYHFYLTLDFIYIACRNDLSDCQVHVRFSIMCSLNCNDIFEMTKMIQCL